jgi:hypothetical protein
MIGMTTSSGPTELSLAAPKTGLPSPPSIDHQPKSRPGIWNSTIDVARMAAKTGMEARTCRGRSPRQSESTCALERTVCRAVSTRRKPT